MTNLAVRPWLGNVCLLAAAMLFNTPASAGANHSAAAHVHGAGEMEIVQDGNGLFISLITPLHNVLGFEHAPRTDSERVKARRVVSLLRANGLFAFSPEAQCKRTGYKLYSDVLNPHSHGPADDHQHHDAENGHADLRASYEFECASPEKLKLIEVRAFRQFPGFEKIEVQALFPKGQVGATLTPTKNRLDIQ
jgi:hypothetical protein